LSVSPLLLRREEHLAGKAARSSSSGASLLQEQKSMTAQAAAAVEQTAEDEDADDTEDNNDEASLVDESSNEDKKKKRKKAPPVVDRFQVFRNLMPGPIPESQKPMFAVAFLTFATACGILVHFIYQQKQDAKEAREAAMRRRLLRMHAAAAAANSDASWTEQGPETQKTPLPGKGFGGKVGGKASGKGHSVENSEAAHESNPISLQTDGKVGGKASGKGLVGKGPVHYSRTPPQSGSESANSTGKASGGKASGKGGLVSAAESQASSDAASNASSETRGPRRPAPKGAAGSAGLGLGQRRALDSNDSRMPPSPVTSRDTEAASRPSDDLSAVKDVKPHKPTAQKKEIGKNGSRIEDLLTMLRAVGKVQTAWRQWRQAQLQKMPADKQCITLICDVLEGADMPNVNRFGGCDPFVECRVVRGDPTNHLRGNVDDVPLQSAQTDVKRNDIAPSWRQRLSMPGVVCEKDLYVQLVLWDYSLTKNQPIAHAVLPFKSAMVTHSPKRRERMLSFTPLPGVEVPDLKTKVSAQFSFEEEYRHKLVVASGSWLPKVKTLGTISSYVEARVFDRDPREASPLAGPEDCLWSGQTSVVSNNVDPSWEQDFEFTTTGVASLWLQLVLLDSNHPHPDVPIGQAVLKMPQAVRSSCGESLVDHRLRLEEMPDRHLTTDLSRAKLVVRTGCEALRA
jgi:hypothetical protein